MSVTSDPAAAFIASPAAKTSSRLLVVTLALANFMSVLDITIANVSLRHIAGSLAIAPSQATWIITSYSLAEGIAMPCTGYVSYRFGARRAFKVALGCFGLASLLAGLSSSFPLLLLTRVAQGCFGGLLIPLAQAVLFDVVPEKERASAVGLIAMSGVVAPSLGPILGGYITETYQWGWIFLINVPVSVLALWAASKLLKNEPMRHGPRRFDFKGLALLISFVGCLQVALDMGTDWNWFESVVIQALMVTSAISFMWFCYIELRHAEPLVNIRVFRNVGYTVGLLTFAALHGIFYANMVIIPQWLQSWKGYSATWAGLVTAATPISGVLVMPLATRVSRSLRPQIMISVGSIIAAAGIYLRTAWSLEADPISIVIPHALFGAAIPMYVVPLTLASLSALHPEERSTGAGLLYAVRTLSAAIVVALMTSLWLEKAQIIQAGLASTAYVPHATTPLASTFGHDQLPLVAQSVRAIAATEAAQNVFLLSAALFLAASIIVWFLPTRDAERIRNA